MKVLNQIALSAICMSLITAPEANAEESKLSVDTSVDVATDYMFRGFNLFDGISVQPEVAAGYDLGAAGSIGAAAWAHLSAEGGRRSSEDKFTEVDYTLSYTLGIYVRCFCI